LNARRLEGKKALKNQLTTFMEDFFNKKFFKIFDLPAFSDEYKETLD